MDSSIDCIPKKTKQKQLLKINTFQALHKGQPKSKVIGWVGGAVGRNKPTLPPPQFPSPNPLLCRLVHGQIKEFLRGGSKPILSKTCWTFSQPLTSILPPGYILLINCYGLLLSLYMHGKSKFQDKTINCTSGMTGLFRPLDPPPGSTTVVNKAMQQQHFRKIWFQQCTLIISS